VADTFDSYGRRLDKLQRSFDGPDKAKLLHAVGKGAKDDVREAVRGDLGDQSMSNWWRGRPIEIAGRYDLEGDDVAEVTPTPRSRGPFRVLEEGRKPGGSYDLVHVGRRRKDGTRRGKSRGRNQGATAAKGTWSDAEQLIEKRTPERVQDEHVKALRSAFG
jgi:hypothetical protein